MICQDCEYASEECIGCRESEGKPFWTQFSEEKTCTIYECCTNTHSLEHCGNCQQLPCPKFTDGLEQSINDEDCAVLLQIQLDQLRKLGKKA